MDEEKRDEPISPQRLTPPKEMAKIDEEESIKDKANQNEEELDFEEEDNESLEEGEEESDGDEGISNYNNIERVTGDVSDSKDQDVKEVKNKSRNKDDDGDEDEDGEVNSDDDLEEGEVKEDDDSETGGGDEDANGQKKLIKKSGNATSNANNQAKTSICRFFAKGQCTWGLNCRFLHLASPVVALPIKLPNQRGFPYQVGLNPTGLHPTGAHPTSVHPTGPHGVTHTTGAHPTGPHPTGHHSIPRPPLNRHQAAALAGTTIHPPHPPPSSQTSSSNTDAAWVRGLRNAKEMLVKANKRKEEESDFEKRFNAGAEDEATSHSKHSHHSRDSPESGDYGDRRSPHNYHARDREKRSHREGNRRDDTREPRETRDTREREPRDNRDRDNREREPRDEYWNSEYERRRRLAFESAPWNDDQSPPPAPGRGNVRPREAAEMYRDPWRRSKSPQAKWSATRRADTSTASKRSYSMSSISNSESGSELSGSESLSGSEESFSGSEVSYSDASEASGRPPREERQKSKSGKGSSRSAKDVNKTRPKPEQSAHHSSSRDRGTGSSSPSKTAQVREKMGSIQVSKNRSNRSSIDEEASGSGPRKKSQPPTVPPASKPRRDSWSDSDSGSMSQSDSSLYSGSESGESDAFSGTNDTPFDDDRRTKGYRNRREAKPHPSSTRQTYDSVRRAPQRNRTSDSPLPPPPPSSSHHSSNAKRMKMSTNASTSSSSIRDSNSLKNRHSSNVPADDLPTSSLQQKSKKSADTPTSPNDGPKKNPIKMTFKKKHSNLKTDRFITAKLNGGKSDVESGEEEESEPLSGVHRSPSPSADADDLDEEGDEFNEGDKPNHNKINDPLSTCNFTDDNEDNDDDADEEKEKDNDDDGEDGIVSNDDDSNGNSSGRQRIQKVSITDSLCKSKDSSKILSTSPSSSSKKTGGSSRREHLLKQLEAVEAMIAKKKAKLQ